MQARIHIHVHAITRACTCECTYVCMHACTCACVCLRVHSFTLSPVLHTSLCFTRACASHVLHTSKPADSHASEKRPLLQTGLLDLHAGPLTLRLLSGICKQKQLCPPLTFIFMNAQPSGAGMHAVDAHAVQLGCICAGSPVVSSTAFRGCSYPKLHQACFVPAFES